MARRRFEIAPAREGRSAPQLTCAAASWLALCACASSPGAEPAAAADVDAGDVRCPADTPAFSAGADTGLLVTGTRNTLQARVVQAQPVAPERFENDWTLRFTDADGTPRDDVTIQDACAFMPVHGHGGAPKEVLKTEPATYQLKGLNLFMRGPWEVQLAVTTSDPTAAAAAQDATNCDRMRRNLGSDLLVIRACIFDD